MESSGVSLLKGHTPALQSNAAQAVANLGGGDQFIKEKFFNVWGLLDNLVKSADQDQNPGLAEVAAAVISNLAATKDSTFKGEIVCVPNLLKVLGMSLSKGQDPAVQPKATWALANLASGDLSIKEEIFNLPRVVKGLQHHEQSTQEKLSDFPGVLANLVKSVYQDQNSDLAEYAVGAIRNLANTQDSTIKGKIAHFPNLRGNLEKSLLKGWSAALQMNAASALVNLGHGERSVKQRIVNHAGLVATLVKLVDQDQLSGATEKTSRSIRTKDYTMGDNVGNFFESDEFLGLTEFFLEEGHCKVQVEVARLVANIACTKDDVIRGRLLNFCGKRLAYFLVQQEDRELQMEAARALANLTYMKDAMLEKGIIQVPAMLNALANSLSHYQDPNLQAHRSGEIGKSASIENDRNGDNVFRDEICNLQVEVARVLVNWAISKDDLFKGEIFSSPGMLVWAGMESKGLHSELGSKCKLRSDIQILGLASWEEQFNAKQMFALYDMRTNQKGVNFVFFHAQAMAKLFGVGLEHAMVSVIRDPELQIMILEIGYKPWKDLWLDSHTSSFKPMLFRSLEESSSGSDNHGVTNQLDSLDFSTLDSFEYRDAKSYISFGPLYKKWIEDLVQYLQHDNGIGNDGVRNEEDGVSECGEQGGTVEQSDGTGHDQEGDTGNVEGGGSGNGEGGIGGSGNEEDGGSGDAHGGGSGNVGGGGSGNSGAGGSGNGGGSGNVGAGGTGDTHSGGGGGGGDAESGGSGNAQGSGNWSAQKNGDTGNDGNGEPSKSPKNPNSGKVVVDVQLKRKSDFYNTYESLKDEVEGEVTDESFNLARENSKIIPDLKIEFLWVSEFLRNVNVDFTVQYNISDTRTNEFGCYQNDLQISFSCPEAEASQRVIKVDDKIISQMREVSIQTTEKSEQSTSNKRHNVMSGLLRLKFPPLDYTLVGGNKSEETAQKGLTDARSSFHQCLAHPPTFVVIPTSKVNDLSYRTSYLFNIEPAQHWEDKRWTEIAPTGLYANLKLSVRGEWEVISDHDDRPVKFQFEAAKKLFKWQNPAKSSGERQVESKCQSLKNLTNWAKHLLCCSVQVEVEVSPGNIRFDQVWQGLTRELIFDTNFGKNFGELKSSESYRIRDERAGPIRVIVEVMDQCYNRFKKT